MTLGSLADNGWRGAFFDLDFDLHHSANSLPSTVSQNLQLEGGIFLAFYLILSSLYVFKIPCHDDTLGVHSEPCELLFHTLY